MKREAVSRIPCRPVTAGNKLESQFPGFLSRRPARRANQTTRLQSARTEQSCVRSREQKAQNTYGQSISAELAVVAYTVCPHCLCGEGDAVSAGSTATHRFWPCRTAAQTSSEGYGAKPLVAEAVGGVQVSGPLPPCKESGHPTSGSTDFSSMTLPLLQGGQEATVSW